MQLYLDNFATCISKATCVLGKPNGVASYIYEYPTGYSPGLVTYTEQYACFSR